MLKRKRSVIVRRPQYITIAKNGLKAIEKNNQTLKVLEASWLEVMYNWNLIDPKIKVINLKYSKHWPYTVAHTINCVFSKMLNHGLNFGLFLSIFKLIPCPIHWIVYVLACLNFILEFCSSFSTAQNSRLCPDS